MRSACTGIWHILILHEPVVCSTDVTWSVPLKLQTLVPDPNQEVFHRNLGIQWQYYRFCLLACLLVKDRASVVCTEGIFYGISQLTVSLE